METSSRPAVAFSLTAELPPASDDSSQVGFFFALPLSVEQDMERRGGTVIATQPASSADACLAQCAAKSGCASWTWTAGSCTLQSDVPLNAFEAGSFSGVAGAWSRPQVDVRSDGALCSTLNRVGSGPAHGDVSLCVAAEGGTGSPSVTFGGGAQISSLWADFADDGALSGSPNGPDAIGAAAVRVGMDASNRQVALTITLSWNFPHRDYLGTELGNFYLHLWEDSVAAGQDMLQSLQEVVADIAALHGPFFESSMPAFLSDFYVNSLSHVRSAMWFADGRWRQWEAYDCVNVDSVHNDGERHIPYISALRGAGVAFSVQCPAR